MSTPPSNRRPGQPGRPGPDDRAPRRREPLFPLEDDDIAPRRRPPQPLADLVSDLDEALPGRAARPARPAPPRDPGPPPPPPLPPRLASTPPERAPEARPAPRRGEARPSPRQAELATGERSQRPALRAAPATARLPEVAAGLREARAAYDETQADLWLSEQLARPQASFGRPAAPAIELPSWAVLLVVAAASLLVLMTLGGTGGADGVSRWAPPFFGGEAAPVAAPLAGAANLPGDYRLEAAPSVSAETIDRILASYGSPATGTGAVWYNLGLKYGIDPAFAVAFFIHESSAGTASGWAGLKPGGGTTHNVGNIICAGYPTCFNRFRDYPSWEAGIEDWYRLIDVEYIQGRGHQTVADIIPVYAPAFENNVQLYVDTVNMLVDQWRRGEVP